MRKAALLALLLAACGQNTDSRDYSQPGAVADGDMYVSASLGEGANLVWFLSGDSASHEISGYLYNGLLTYDKDLNLTGELAERWDISDDGLQITFHLRPNLKWQDGKPLTAHDVMATYKAVIAPETRTPYAGDYQMVKKAEVLDDLTFRVSYDKPFAPALSSWTMSVLPAHILAKTPDVNTTSLVTEPLANGPFTLTKWDRSRETILSANEKYHKGRPHIDHVRIRVIPDQDTQFLELRAGRIDSMGLKPVQYERLTDDEKFAKRFNKYRYLGNQYVYLGFNLNKAPFNDKRVRQALSYATPREALVDGILRGHGIPAFGPFKPGTWAASETLKPYPYDLEKAKALLVEAGFTERNGRMEKDGQPLAFTIVTNQGNDQRIKTAEILQQAYKQIGVQVDIRVQEWATFIENTINGRNFEAFILGWSLTPEPDPFDIWHSSKTGPREFNIVGFHNPTADKLIEEARSTFDKATRKKLYDEFQQILHEEQPYVFLYAPYSLVSVHKRFKGIEPAPAGIGYNFEDWYVPLAQQMYPRATMTE